MSGWIDGWLSRPGWPDEGLGEWWIRLKVSETICRLSTSDYLSLVMHSCGASTFLLLKPLYSLIVLAFRIVFAPLGVIIIVVIVVVVVAVREKEVAL